MQKVEQTGLPLPKCPNDLKVPEALGVGWEGGSLQRLEAAPSEVRLRGAFQPQGAGVVRGELTATVPTGSQRQS